MAEGLSAPSLPFANADPASNEATPSIPRASSPSWLTGTAPTLETPSGPALPFSSPGAAEPAAPTPAQANPAPRESAPAEPRAAPLPAWLTGTAPTLDTNSGPALPFKASTPHGEPEKPEPRKGALPAWLTGTALALDAPRGPALPFTPQARTTPPPAEPAPLPAPALPSPPPSLTLEQHAYLCVELAIDPARSAETLARYHQTPVTKAQIDAYYRDKVAADPATRAAWNYAYQTYGAWLAARRPPSR